MNKKQAVEGLINLSGTLCPECGYIHPVPKNGICPVAHSNINLQQGKNQHINANINSNENILSKKNIEIMKIKNLVNTLISERYDSLNFPNEYVEDKFFKNISVFLNEKLKEMLDDFDC